ncbi:MAG TPA: Hsp20/alpha crystallin family protein [Gemmatimonadales bacterium]
MAVTRYRDPASLFGLQRLNRILDEAFGGSGFPEQGSVITSTLFAPTDVVEDEHALQIVMELPGVEPDNVRLSLENNVLTIRGEKRQEIDENRERIHRSERIYGVFERTFVLPNTVDPDKIDAQFENGVLLVKIPKSERARPREIRVNASSTGSSEVRTTTTQSQSHRKTAGESQRANRENARDPEEEGSAARSGR